MNEFKGLENALNGALDKVAEVDEQESKTKVIKELRENNISHLSGLISKDEMLFHNREILKSIPEEYENEI